MNKIKLLVASFVSLVILSGCGGGGGGSAGVPAGPEVSSSPFGLLKPAATEEELVRSLQTGLQGASYVVSAGEVIELAVDGAPAPAEGLAEGDAAGGSFSGTNLQEAGVDEADIVKYDGEVLYVVDYHQEPDYGPPVFIDDPSEELPFDTSIIAPQTPIIRLFATDPGIPAAQELSHIELQNSEFSVDGLYLSENNSRKQMVAVGQTNSYVYWELFASDYYWRNGRTQVRSWDVQSPVQPTDAWSLELDGSLLSSRRIGNILYLVTSYSPTIEGLVSYPQTEDDIAANKDIIANTELDQLLPQIRREDGVSQALVSATDCMVPNEAYQGLVVPPSDGSLVTVTAIDLTNPDSVESLCLNTFASGFYASSEALYITANVSGNSTLIHKILFTESGPEYRGSGEVPGYIGTSNPAFLMSEQAGDLRVVSSIWEDTFFPLELIEPDGAEPGAQASVLDDGFGQHRLTILRESDDGTRLMTVSRLPNTQNPQPIGKPQEQIYSARFLGDRAYVVTFQIIDPLYVLDLSDPENPLIAGELEIPGFSTLLQPVGDNLLLGIGHDVPLDGANQVQGVKLALFDVGVVSEPISLGEVVIGKQGSYSPALYDHHALTILQVDGRYRAALPIERYDTEVEQSEEVDNPWTYYDWTDSALYLFDIDPVGGTLSSSGTLVLDKRSEDQPYSNIGTYNSRSVLHDEAVFFVNGGTVWSALWGETRDFSASQVIQN